MSSTSEEGSDVSVSSDSPNKTPMKKRTTKKRKLIKSPTLDVSIDEDLPLTKEDIAVMEEEQKGHTFSVDSTKICATVSECKIRIKALEEALASMDTHYEKMANAYSIMVGRATVKSTVINAINQALVPKIMEEDRKRQIANEVTTRKAIQEEVHKAITKLKDDLKAEICGAINSEVLELTEKEAFGDRGVKEAVTNLSKRMEEAFAKPGVETYANAAGNWKSVDRKHKHIPVHIAGGKKVAVVNSMEFYIQPNSSAKTKFTSSEQVKDKLRSAINPAMYGMKVTRLLKARDNGVRVVVEAVDLEKLRKSDELKKCGLEVVNKEKNEPRLIIYGVPAAMSTDELPAKIREANLEDDDIPLKCVYKYPARERTTTSFVIETSAEGRTELLRKSRIFIGFAACRVEDHVRVLQCYKCLQFGHIAGDCQGKDKCGHCAGSHESRACKRKQNIKCYNCTMDKLEDTAHSAFDGKRCPILARKLAEKARSTNYTVKDE